jgi:hypothetical protein
MGESIDNRIARELQPMGVEPLTLYAGKMSGYIDEVLSYRGPKQLRAAEPNPYNAYVKLFGLGDLEAEALAKLKASRTSVNDLVRAEMQSLLGRKDSTCTSRASAISRSACRATSRPSRSRPWTRSRGR